MVRCGSVRVFQHRKGSRVGNGIVRQGKVLDRGAGLAAAQRHELSVRCGQNLRPLTADFRCVCGKHRNDRGAVFRDGRASGKACRRKNHTCADRDVFCGIRRSELAGAVRLNGKERGVWKPLSLSFIAFPPDTVAFRPLFGSSRTNQQSFVCLCTMYSQRDRIPQARFRTAPARGKYCHTLPPARSGRRS